MNQLSQDKLRTKLSERMEQLVKNKPSGSQQLLGGGLNTFVSNNTPTVH